MDTSTRMNPCGICCTGTRTSSGSRALHRITVVMNFIAVAAGSFHNIQRLWWCLVRRDRRVAMRRFGIMVMGESEGINNGIREANVVEV